nr:hypothetical protein [Tanacetum cinerariifolium]
MREVLGSSLVVRVFLQERKRSGVYPLRRRFESCILPNSLEKMINNEDNGGGGGGGGSIWWWQQIWVVVVTDLHGSSLTPIYSPRSSTPPCYSPGASTPQSYSLGTSRNVECSNCKHLLDKITILEATVDMYMHPEQHTVNSAALFHEVYSNMGKLDLE